MADETSTFDPNEYTVDEVNDYLADNPDQVGTVLDAEAQGKARTGILEGPHATPADPTPTVDTGKADTVAEAGEKAPVQVGEKYEKGYEGFVPSRDGDNPVDLTLAGVTGQNQDA